MAAPSSEWAITLSPLSNVRVVQAMSGLSFRWSWNVFTKWNTCAEFCFRFVDQLAWEVLSQVQTLVKPGWGAQKPWACCSTSRL